MFTAPTSVFDLGSIGEALARLTSRAGRAAPSVIRSRPRVSLPRDMDLLDAGAEYSSDGKLEYLWYRVRMHKEHGDEERFWAVKLHILTFIPEEERSKGTVLPTMRKVLKGLYNAGIQPVILFAGIFDPPIGVVQCYGVKSEGSTLKDAAASAEKEMVALMGVMANFQQIQLEPPDIEISRWLTNAFARMPFVSVAVGHPDPRDEGAKGLGFSEDTTAKAPLTLQQNEMVMRAFADRREEFLFEILPVPVNTRDIYRVQEEVAQRASIWVSKVHFTRNVSAGVGITALLTGGMGNSVATSQSHSHAHGIADTTGHSQTWGTSHQTADASTWQQSHAASRNWSNAFGTSHVEALSSGHAHSIGVAHGHTHMVGSNWAQQVGTANTLTHSQTHSVGGSHSWGHAVQQGWSASDARNWAHTANHGWGTADTQSWAHTANQGWSHASGTGTAVSSGVAHTSGWNAGGHVGGSVGVVSGGVNYGRMGSTSHYGSASQTISSSNGHNWGYSDMHGGAHTASQTWGYSNMHGGAHTVGRSGGISNMTGGSRSWANSQGVSSGVTHSTGRSWGGSVQNGQSVVNSVGDTSSTGRTVANGQTAVRSVGGGVTDSVAHGGSHTVANGTSQSHGVSQAHAVSNTSGVSQGRTLGLARTMAGLIGVSPSVSFGKSYMGEDHAAMMVSEALADQENILRTIGKEGGMITYVYLLTKTPEGKALAETALPQAFHGTQDVATPFRTRALTPAAEAYVRARAMMFAPSRRPETSRWALEPHKDATLMTLLQTAALTSPGMFEEGPATTVMGRIPPFAFHRFQGDVLLGFQRSYETGNLTRSPVLMRRSQMMNFLYAADSRYGKSVTAERVILETTRQWHFRSIVLDFGFGWRKLFRVYPRTDVWGLYPGSPNPIRWNLLQVGEHITPEAVLNSVPEIIVNAGQMGQRQLGFIRRALKALWLEHGVLTSDKAVQDPAANFPGSLRWEGEGKGRHQSGMYLGALEKSVLSPEEAALLNSRFGKSRRPGQRIAELEDDELQALAVERSKGVDIAMLTEKLQEYYDHLSGRQATSQESLEGLLLRLEPFASGRMAEMYGRGPDSMDLTMLAQPYGIAILEGGEMDDYAKALVLGLAAWFLYTDAVIRKRKNIGSPSGTDAPVNIVFEEANKILNGVSDGKDYGGRYQTDIFGKMFRDAAKYDFYLHALVQSPSALPEGIVSNCNNQAFGMLKGAQDQKMILPAIGKIPTGYRDQEYLRFAAEMPQGMFVGRFGLNPKRARRELAAFLFEPLQVLAKEPSDDEIWEKYIGI